VGDYALMCMKPLATLGLAAFGLLASFALAGADEAPNAAANPPAAAAPISPEEVSLRGFGSLNAQCLEWSDACAICLRDEKDAIHCSTPGIACQPAAIACRREKAK
jgi:hypothetical protein